MNFAEKLVFLRKDKGLSQEELADKIAVSRQAISKWEQGAAMPDTENVIELSKFFETSTDYLLLDQLDQDSYQTQANGSPDLDGDAENFDKNTGKNIKRSFLTRNSKLAIGLLVGIFLEIVAILGTYLLQSHDKKLYGCFLTNNWDYLFCQPLITLMILGFLIILITIVWYIWPFVWPRIPKQRGGAN